MEMEKARQRAEQRTKDIAKNAEHIFYSTRYYDPEPHVLLFKREKDYQLKYLSGAKQTSG
ncbi:hypothetical protein BGX28_006749 [Mortierella sp. GBA30]|nr:hypothetical protein BGX28_006749 [Mortierella sp. GBA30]